jgi:RimJ/RimL family protein N-acetyltransferase
MTDGEEGEEPEFRSSIETRRLYLRQPGPHDEAEIATLSAGRAIAENLAALPCPVNGEHGETFVVLERKAKRLIGAAMYGPMAERRRATEIACWIGESHWGFGYATEATQALIDRAFADERIDILWCSNRVMNHRARRVIEKCGFQFRETGMVRSPILKGAVPVERFVLERRNWAALRAWGLARATRERNGEPHDTAA